MYNHMITNIHLYKTCGNTCNCCHDGVTSTNNWDEPE